MELYYENKVKISESIEMKMKSKKEHRKIEKCGSLL